LGFLEAAAAMGNARGDRQLAALLAGLDEPDLGDFRFSACVDTVGLDVELRDPARVHTMKATIAVTLGIDPSRVWAEWINPDPAGCARSWSLTIQDPTMPLLRGLEVALDGRWGLSGPVCVSYVDVAVDARLRGVTSDVSANTFERQEPLLALLRSRLKGKGAWRYDCGNNPAPVADGDFERGREWARAQQARFDKRMETDREKFPKGHTGYLDLRGGAFARLYFKTKDSSKNKDGDGDLDQSEWRTRLEVRLPRGAVALSLSDLDGFKFERLARWFSFAQSADDSVCYAHSSGTGTVVCRADSELNLRFKRALTRLTKGFLC
jgi:hypothetical protein